MMGLLRWKQKSHVLGTELSICSELHTPDFLLLTYKMYSSSNMGKSQRGQETTSPCHTHTGGRSTVAPRSSQGDRAHTGKCCTERLSTMRQVCFMLHNPHSTQIGPNQQQTRGWASKDAEWYHQAHPMSPGWRVGHCPSCLTNHSLTTLMQVCEIPGNVSTLPKRL
jgi:hypothetical protein